MTPRLVLQRLALVACALLGCGAGAVCCGAEALPAVPVTALAKAEPATTGVVMEPPCRLATPSLDYVAPLFVGEAEPELRLAQRAIRRDLGAPAMPEEGYALVDVPGWKSVGGAAALSFALPGTGQLYAGSKRGYLYLGVEAVALLSYATFQAKSEDKRDEYHAFVGDPNQADSRFSFDRLGNDVSAEEIARLRTIYERDQAEFYQAVTLQAQYAGGWENPDERFDAQTIAEDADTQRSRSRFGLYTLIANHLVSAVD